jgi:hypothetical protein
MGSTIQGDGSRGSHRQSNSHRRIEFYFRCKLEPLGYQEIAASARV